jgi:hypothetical protein
VTGVSRFESLVGEFYNPYLCSAPQSDGERKLLLLWGFYPHINPSSRRTDI